MREKKGRAFEQRLFRGKRARGGNMGADWGERLGSSKKKHR